MGLGYQKWISSQRPRKPFSRDRKPFQASIYTTHFTDFAPHKAEVKKKIDLTALPIIVLLLIFATIAIKQHNSPPAQDIVPFELAQQRHKRDKAEGIAFLFASAKYELAKGNIENAKREINQVLTISPDHPVAERIMMFVLVKDCMQNGNCDDNLTKKLIWQVKLNPENAELRELAVAYFSATGNENLAIATLNMN